MKVAFLRSINVGNRRVTNDRLLELFEAAGCRGVATFQAAGNVIFERGPARTAIEEALRAALGFDVPVYVRTAGEIARIATAPPFPDADPQKPASLLVSFFHRPVPVAVEAASNDVDVLRADGKELYWLAGRGVGASTLDWRSIERLLPDPGTNRNLTTVRKLAAKLA